MSELMVVGANRVLSDLDYISVVERDSTYWYVWDGTAAIRFKHHRPNGRTSNHVSGAQKIIAHQMTLPGLPEGVTYLSCGPTLDRSESSIAQILLTKPRGRKNEWAIDLERLAGGDTVPETVTLPFAPDASPAAAKIIPFRRTKIEG